MNETGLLAGRTKMDWYAEMAGMICTVRAAALIIKDNNFLAAKSPDYDCYYTVGGGVQINETSEEAIIREIYEETGYRLEIDKLAFVQERFYEVDKHRYHEIVFFYLMIDSDDVNISDSSFTDLPKETLHWLPLDDLNKINLVPEFLKNKSFNNISNVEHIISKE
ncbi:NUDIX hydrolase [Clostridium cellulovorans]|uniref:NUDIX hydrolase n=1 Tax=Clostridium cellulovorans (strain ATCC 35296 / DSM 3052 / OCM 3 / 743B) TaxID=573061 RepID=D9SQG1_CLOC7|nr:NUDIX domain-containing protein [Clostridium cellulovorans]ADL50228.1 NUDIX hydrolase [Clostridium cellulovorans 743B]